MVTGYVVEREGYDVLVSTDGITLPEVLAIACAVMGFVVVGVHTPRRILADAFASSCLTVNGFAHTMGLNIPVIAILV